MKKTIVSLAKGKDRYENIQKSLEQISDQIKQKISSRKEILVKVNFVSADNQLAATHPDAVKALLDFFKPKFDGKIKIVETGSNAQKGFLNYSYKNLAQKYSVELDDLAGTELETIFLFDPNLKRRIKAGYYKKALNCEFLISITPAKTHDYGIVTLGLKNVAVGFLKNASLVHQGYQAFNQNLFLLIKKRTPDLSIIDGTIGMQGNGPIYGNPINSDWVLASLDPIQADVVGAKLMGFEPKKIGYLYYCLKNKLAVDDFSQVEIIGARLERCQTKFVPSPAYEKQLEWEKEASLKEKIKAFLVTRFYTPYCQSYFGKKVNIRPLAGLFKRWLGFQ